MAIVSGIEYHDIIRNVFGDVRGLYVSSQLQVNCPRCQEREGLSEPDGKFNLEINTSTNKKLFRCWKCEEPKFSGSLFKLIKQYGSSTDFQLYKAYAGTFNYEVNKDDDVELETIKLPNEMIYFSEMNENNLDHFEAYNYLVVERKISKDIILKYRLGFCVEGKYAKRIIIPSFDENGGINYFVARSYDDKFNRNKYENPKSSKDMIIFNEGYINWDSTIYIMEGVFEMFTVPINTVLLLGTVLHEKLFTKIKKYKPEIVVVLDPDAFIKSIDIFLILRNIYIGCEDKLKIVKIPGKKDLDYVRKNYGVGSVIEILKTARQLTTDDLFEKKLTY